MRRAPSLVRDNCGYATHYWFPIRICEAGYENVPGFDSLQLTSLAHNSDSTRADLLAHRLSFHEWQSRFSTQAIRFRSCCARFGGMNGLRSGLNDKELASYAILGPFDVHWLWMTC